MTWRPAAPLLLALAACAHAGRAPPGEEGQPVVAEVEIEGNEIIGDDEIEEGLGTQATGRWPWSDVRRVDSVVAATDERRIETIYARRGYHAVEVEHEVVPLGRDRARVLFRVREGPPFTLEAVELDGLDGLPEGIEARIRGSLPVRPGEVVRYEAFETARARVEHHLRAAGYLRAEVEGGVDVYLEREAASITIRATPGPLHRYGELEIEGLAAYPSEPLRAIARRVLPRGEIASPAGLEEAQGRLFELGAFRSVRVSTRTPPEDGGEARIVVRADELPVHSVVLGGGVGVEQNLQQIELVAEYGNTSLAGSATRLSWRTEGAFRFLPSFYDRQRTGLSAESGVEITRPEVLDRTDVAVRGAYRRAFREAYEANVLTARLGLPYRLAPGLRLVPALNYERYLDVSVRSPVGDPAALPLALGCPEPCGIAYVSADLVRDRRNDPIVTRRGTLLLAGVQYGVPLSGARFHYLRLEPEARAYLPLTRALTLATRARLGLLFPLGRSEESPLPQRFFGGGEGGHRGFGPEQLAPLVEDRAGGFIPLGGEGLWLATAELRLRPWRQWELVGFADLGDVTLDALDFDAGRAHLALGLGVRYLTVAGPVRLDVAYRLPRRTRHALDTGRPVETSPTDYLTFFLSLGEAF